MVRKSSLNEYYEKREFTKTPEPKGEVKETGQSRFVIQEHHASRLHWDFRLEMDGVLKSWAVPKEPPQLVGVKRLAVQTEDHPIDYISFEGVIPKGEYGAGTVKIWDGGSYDLDSRDQKKLVFRLNGLRLLGRYVLVNTRGNQWIFFKSKD